MGLALELLLHAAYFTYIFVGTNKVYSCRPRGFNLFGVTYEEYDPDTKKLKLFLYLPTLKLF